MITQKDISIACGVSLATVSKALSGQTDIGEQTAQHIREVARSMGYLPNSAARALKTNRSHNIGILFVDSTSCGLRHEYFSEIIDSLKVKSESLGYDVTFISCNIGNLPMTYYEHAKYRNCDGVIIASVDFKDPNVIQLAQSELPVVAIDYVFDGRTSVLSDNISGMQDIVQHVYDKGHRRIAIIHGEDTGVTQKRLASFRKACSERGLELPEEYVKCGIYHDPKSSGLATRELLALRERPTCILYPDDFSFIGGMNEIEHAGLSIPDDISVVGYDGILLSQVLRPRLTTYRQDAVTIGTKAAEAIVEAIEFPKTHLPQQIVVTGSLWKGDTVKEI